MKDAMYYYNKLGQGNRFNRWKLRTAQNNPLSNITDHQYRTPQDKNRLDYFKI